MTSNISGGHWESFSAATIWTLRWRAWDLPRDFISLVSTLGEDIFRYTMIGASVVFASCDGWFIVSQSSTTSCGEKNASGKFLGNFFSELGGWTKFRIFFSFASGNGGADFLAAIFYDWINEPGASWQARKSYPFRLALPPGSYFWSAIFPWLLFWSDCLAMIAWPKKCLPLPWL